jgi:hypothetical protein
MPGPGHACPGTAPSASSALNEDARGDDAPGVGLGPTQLQIRETFAARGPFGLSTISNCTLSPSLSVRNPSARISE